jgi:hypothetical protein
MIVSSARSLRNLATYLSRSAPVSTGEGGHVPCDVIVLDVEEDVQVRFGHVAQDHPAQPARRRCAGQWLDLVRRQVPLTVAVHAHDEAPVGHQGIQVTMSL